VRAAGVGLERSGAATSAYTDAMVATVEKLGPYIVIAPGLALAHARPSEAVIRTGFSWVRPAQPVEFGHAKNDPVSLVVGLAAIDHEVHQAALMELATIFTLDGARTQLDAVPDVAALRQALTHLSERR
jgi:PTS system ascorbate-specific IIA component